MAILDPPYNLDQTYADYDDRKSRNDYLAWAAEWLAMTRGVLKPDGALWLVMYDSLISELDVMAKAMGFHKQNSVIWYYTFGVNSAKKFTPSHTHLVHYTMHRKKFTFNSDNPSLRVPSARQVKYNDKRANSIGRLPDNTWILFPEQLQNGFPANEDTWLFSRVCGTFRERKKHSPNQLPLPMVERMLLFTSKPGDLVLDPFLGTGTTGVAAVKHGRRFLGIDVSPACIRESELRIAGTEVKADSHDAGRSQGRARSRRRADDRASGEAGGKAPDGGNGSRKRNRNAAGKKA